MLAGGVVVVVGPLVVVVVGGLVVVVAGFVVGGPVVGGTVVAVVVDVVFVGPPGLQGAPLIVQLEGAPVPVAVKPKVVDAPVAISPLYERLTAVTWLPAAVRVASQKVLNVVPAGRSNSMVHDVVALVELFAIRK